jgi:phage baseplate assembly protein W|tara:strand:- start:327 stop:710 length:384 start_codon:yes stop_codon:yes gene_type:complete
MSGIAVQLPLIRDQEDGFGLLKNYDDVVAQNLKMLILTVPGERIMDPDFGVGARRYLFEQLTEETFQLFKSRLLQQQQKYLPYLVIKNVEFVSSLSNKEVDENTLQIKISYFNKVFKSSGILSLPLT